MENRMETHVNIIGWLHIAFNGLGLLTGALVLVFVVAGGLLGAALYSEPNAAIVITTIGIAVTAVVTLFALPGFVGGIALLKRVSWSRIVIIILGALNLLYFPIGTILGVYTLWALLQPEAEELFRQ